MGVRVAEFKDGRATVYCSTTDWTLGPIFEDADEAFAFLNWIGSDIRSMYLTPDGAVRLENKVAEFRSSQERIERKP